MREVESLKKFSNVTDKGVKLFIIENISKSLYSTCVVWGEKRDLSVVVVRRVALIATVVANVNVIITDGLYQILEMLIVSPKPVKMMRSLKLLWK